MRNGILLLYILSFASGWSGLALLLSGWQKSRRRAALYFMLLMAALLLIQTELLLNWYSTMHLNGTFHPLGPWLDLAGSTLMVAVLPRAFLLSLKEKLNFFEIWYCRIIPFPAFFFGFTAILSSQGFWYYPLLLLLYLTLGYSLIQLFRLLPKQKDRRIIRFFRTMGITTLIFIPLFIFEALRRHFPWAENLDFLELLSVPLFFMVCNLEISLLGFPFLKEKPLPRSIPSTFLESYEITPRERDVLDQLILGKSYQEIAQVLKISPRTVDKHVENIYRKTLVSNRLELLHLLEE